MNEKNVMIELKQVMRNTIKTNGDKDLKKHIYIIKSTLFFISRVILIKKDFKGRTDRDILRELQQDCSENLSQLLIGIEKIEEYKKCEFLDSEIKLKLINIINKIKQESLKEFSLGELYDSFTTNNEKKLLGQVYTPKDIVKAMIHSSFNSEDIIQNPYFKVVDLACGGGYFLIEAYDKIRKIIEENYDKIILFSKATKVQLEKSIDEFILKNNIWGTDIDEFAIYMTRFSLVIKGNIENTNGIAIVVNSYAVSFFSL